MMLRFIEVAFVVLLGALIVTQVLWPLVLRLRGSDRDLGRAMRRREDAEKRLHAAIEDERADELLAAAGKLHGASGRGDLHLNMKWVEAHREEYAGEWVALKDGKLVASAPSRTTLQDEIALRDDLREILVVLVEEKAPEDPASSGTTGADRKKA